MRTIHPPGRPHTVFVLSGGASLVAMQVGMARALYERGLAPDRLVGARLADDLVRYANEAELIVLPALNRHHIPPTDFDHASRLIGEALADARPALGAAQTVEAVAA
jgi:hypothetical protein